MKKVKVINLSRDTVVLGEAEMADSFWLRLKGLLGRKGLLPGKGMIIKPCRSVHTIGMKFAIDVAFVDRHNRICHLVENMGPCKVSPTIKRSSYVIESPAGTFGNTQTLVGDEVELEERKKY